MPIWALVGHRNEQRSPVAGSGVAGSVVPAARQRAMCVDHRNTELGDADLEDAIPQCLIKARRWLQDSNFDMWTMTDAADGVAPDLTLCQW